MAIDLILLSAGLLSLAFAYGHAAWGQKHIMAEVTATGMSALIQTAIFTNVHQTTSFMSVAGIALIVSSMLPDAAAAKALAWLVLAINLGNFLVFIAASLAMNRQALRQTAPQIAVMAMYLCLIVFGVSV